MKRESTKHLAQYTNGVSWAFPLLSWFHCESCKKEFRFELGWKFEVGPYYYSPTEGNIGTTKYLCKTCAPTASEAHVFAVTHATEKCDDMLPPRSE